jgi:hypothetical protein
MNETIGKPIKIILKTNIKGNHIIEFSKDNLYKPLVKDTTGLSQYPLFTKAYKYDYSVIKSLTYNGAVKFFFNQETFDQQVIASYGGRSTDKDIEIHNINVMLSVLFKFNKSKINASFNMLNNKIEENDNKSTEIPTFTMDNAVKTLNLRGEFLVINADTWLSTGMVELARSISPSIGLVYLENISRYGQVKYDKDFHIVKFSEKAVTSVPGWINAGIFHLDPLFFLDWNGKPFSLESHLFVELAQSRQLHAVQLNTDFLDIGIPADYKRFCRWVHEGRKLPL